MYISFAYNSFFFLLLICVDAICDPSKQPKQYFKMPRSTIRLVVVHSKKHKRHTILNETNRIRLQNVEWINRIKYDADGVNTVNKYYFKVGSMHTTIFHILFKILHDLSQFQHIKWSISAESFCLAVLVKKVKMNNIVVLWLSFRCCSQHFCMWYPVKMSDIFPHHRHPWGLLYVYYLHVSSVGYGNSNWMFGSKQIGSCLMLRINKLKLPSYMKMIEKEKL